MREHVDLPTLDALHAEWRQHPPVHHLVAAYLDYKPPAEAGSVERDQALQEMVSMMPVRTDAPRLDTSAWQAFDQGREPGDG